MGLDIGFDSIKAVELSRSGGGIELGLSAVAPIRLKQSDIQETPAFDREATLSAIQRLISESNIPTKKVVTAVSGESVIVRILRMPASIIEGTKEEDLEFAIKGEARDFIPFEMEDIIFDYQKLGIVDTEGAKMIEVLIVAVKKETIYSLMDLLKEAGLQPIIIDVGSFALVNALNYGGGINPDEIISIVNIGSDITSIAIMKDGMTRFTRDFNVAGNNITNAISSGMGINWFEAEDLKKKHGMHLGSEESFDTGSEMQIMSNDFFENTDSTNVVDDLSGAIDDITGGAGRNSGDAQAQQISPIIQGVLSDICSEVKRSLLYYESQLEGETVGKIILSGGTAKLLNIVPYFESFLDLKTEIINPLASVSHRLSNDELVDLSPLIGVGIGLALRNVIT